MSKRKWTRIGNYESEILKLREAGLTRQEIADELGLDKLKNWITLYSKGNPYDNAMAENFFSILKTEYIYRYKPKTLKEADDLIDWYIHFYNYERIQTKTGVA